MASFSSVDVWAWVDFSPMHCVLDFVKLCLDLANPMSMHRLLCLVLATSIVDSGEWRSNLELDPISLHNVGSGYVDHWPLSSNVHISIPPFLQNWGRGCVGFLQQTVDPLNDVMIAPGWSSRCSQGWVECSHVGVAKFDAGPVHVGVCADDVGLLLPYWTNKTPAIAHSKFVRIGKQEVCSVIGNCRPRKYTNVTTMGGTKRIIDQCNQAKW